MFSLLLTVVMSVGLVILGLFMITRGRSPFALFMGIGVSILGVYNVFVQGNKLLKVFLQPVISLFS